MDTNRQQEILDLVQNRIKQNMSPSRKVKVTNNQVSRNSPFKRYKANGDTDSSNSSDDKYYCTEGTYMKNRPNQPREYTS